MAMSDWAPFFAAEVSACATLAGLVIVAISINLSRILAQEHLPARAAESLVSLTAALSICGIGVIPTVGDIVFGAAAVLLGAAPLAFGLRNQIVSFGLNDLVSVERQIISGIARLAASGPFVIGGALLVAHAPSGLAWLAAGVVATLAVAVMNAWVLLVEILR